MYEKCFQIIWVSEMCGVNAGWFRKHAISGKMDFFFWSSSPHVIPTVKSQIFVRHPFSYFRGPQNKIIKIRGLLSEKKFSYAIKFCTFFFKVRKEVPYENSSLLMQNATKRDGMERNFYDNDKNRRETSTQSAREKPQKHYRRASFWWMRMKTQKGRGRKKKKNT